MTEKKNFFCFCLVDTQTVIHSIVSESGGCLPCHKHSPPLRRTKQQLDIT